MARAAVAYSNTWTVLEVTLKTAAVLTLRCGSMLKLLIENAIELCYILKARCSFYIVVLVELDVLQNLLVLRRELRAMQHAT